MNLEELHQWYAEEQKRIQGLDLDMPAKQAKLLDLQEMFLSMSQRILGEPGTAIMPLGPRLLVDQDAAVPMLPRVKAE